MIIKPIRTLYAEQLNGPDVPRFERRWEGRKLPRIFYAPIQRLPGILLRTILKGNA